MAIGARQTGLSIFEPLISGDFQAPQFTQNCVENKPQGPVLKIGKAFLMKEVRKRPDPSKPEADRQAAEDHIKIYSCQPRSEKVGNLRPQLAKRGGWLETGINNTR